MNFFDLKNNIEKRISGLGGEVGVFVKFLGTDEGFGINESMQFWAASVIKLPIMVEFFYQVSEGKISDVNKKVTIKKENRVLGSGILKLLNKTDEFTLRDLLVFMIVVSDNSATNEIVDHIGWESVERRMQSLGLGDTTFRHKMVVEAGRGLNLTTAKDMASLLEKVFKREVPFADEILEILSENMFRTRMPLLLPNEVNVAHKDGSLSEAVHDVGVVYSKNPFVFAFLSDDQKDKVETVSVLAECAKVCFDYSEQQRYDDAKDLLRRHT